MFSFTRLVASLLVVRGSEYNSHPFRRNLTSLFPTLAVNDGKSKARRAFHFMFYISR
jgi:hypothetical protein